eukprot:10408017-Alexandrium_andersonii.AAC.1
MARKGKAGEATASSSAKAKPKPRVAKAKAKGGKAKVGKAPGDPNRARVAGLRAWRGYLSVPHRSDIWRVRVSCAPE